MYLFIAGDENSSGRFYLFPTMALRAMSMAKVKLIEVALRCNVQLKGQIPWPLSERSLATELGWHKDGETFWPWYMEIEPTAFEIDHHLIYGLKGKARHEQAVGIGDLVSWQMIIIIVKGRSWRQRKCSVQSFQYS